jgi:hypothetical protein
MFILYWLWYTIVYPGLLVLWCSLIGGLFLGACMLAVYAGYALVKLLISFVVYLF